MQRGLRWGCAFAAAAGLSACDHVQSALAPVADESRGIAHAWASMLWIGGAVLLLLLLALGLALWRNGGNGHGRAGERTLWFGLLGFVVFSTGLLTVLAAQGSMRDRRPHASAVEPVHVRLTARQWWWQVEYLDADATHDFTTANELHLPVDRPARIELRSGDVIHSVWIPLLDGAQDLVPGRVDTITMTPRQVGRYRGRCAAFCGLQHAHMALDVRVDDASGFAAWQARQRAPASPPAARSTIAGRNDFRAVGCATCHAIDGSGIAAGSVIGPDLTHLASRPSLAAGAMPLDRSTLETWIVDPQRHKPGTTMPTVALTPEQRSDIADYLMSLD
jgi:cytochrome c oxidase subunit 2